MTWEQTAEVLAREVDRLQKEVDEKAFVNDIFSKIIFESCEVNTRNQDTLKGMARRWRKEADRLQQGVVKCIEWMNSPAEGSDFSELEEMLQSLVSPAAEGGGAANGGESQALQAAILGLHTLAGEFPTPTWKTREDYLQATISEINEILGKQ